MASSVSWRSNGLSDGIIARFCGTAYFLLLGGLAAGCSAGSGIGTSGSAPTAQLDSSAAVSADPPRDEVIAVLTQPIPERLVVDGSVSEWPGLAQRAAGSPWVMVALAPERLVIAARFGRAGGLALTLADPVEQPLPLLGWTHSSDDSFLMLTEGTCQQDQVEDYSTGPGWMTGQPHSSEVVSACVGLLENNEQAMVAYRKRFIRHLRISERGIDVLDDAGAVLSLPAKMAFHDGVIEAELPIEALPRLHHAPLWQLSVAARVDPPAEPTERSKADVELTVLALAKPIVWQPLPDLRAFYLNEEAWSHSLTRHLSYHPSEPDELAMLGRVRVFAQPTDSAAMRALHLQHPWLAETTLRLTPTPLSNFGDVTVAFVEIDNITHLISLKSGTMTGHAPFSDLAVEHIAERAGELHIIAFHAGRRSWHAQGGYVVASRFIVYAIDNNGRLRDISDDNPVDGWDEFTGAPVINADFTRFEVRGKLLDGQAKTVVWSWREADKRYAAQAQ